MGFCGSSYMGLQTCKFHNQPIYFTTFFRNLQEGKVDNVEKIGSTGGYQKLPGGAMAPPGVLHIKEAWNKPCAAAGGACTPAMQFENLKYIQHSCVFQTSIWGKISRYLLLQIESELS